MRASEIFKIFGLQIFQDKELSSDQEILKTIERCKQLAESMRMDLDERHKKAQ
jgi:hypothetical protein